MSWEDDTIEHQRFTSFLTLEDVPEDVMNNWFESDVIEGHPPETLMDSILMLSAENALRATSLSQLIPKNSINNDEINDKITHNIVVSKFLDHNNAVPTIDQSTPSQGVGEYKQLSTPAGDKKEGIPTSCDDMGWKKLGPKGGGNIEPSIVTPSSTASELELDPTSSTNRVDNCEQNDPANVSENSRLLGTSEGIPKNDVVNCHDINKVVNNKELEKAVTPVLKEQGDHT